MALKGHQSSVACFFVTLPTPKHNIRPRKEGGLVGHWTIFRAVVTPVATVSPTPSTSTTVYPTSTTSITSSHSISHPSQPNITAQSWLCAAIDSKIRSTNCIRYLGIFCLCEIKYILSAKHTHEHLPTSIQHDLEEQRQKFRHFRLFSVLSFEELVCCWLFLIRKREKPDQTCNGSLLCGGRRVCLLYTSPSPRD